jgi:2-methylcitrate dehydratase
MIAKESRINANGDSQATGPPFDAVIESIVTYVYDFTATNLETIEKAKTALIDALGCAIESLHESAELRRLVGPTWMSSRADDGFKLPGTRYELEPLKAAFDLGSMIRYLDHNDAFPGAEWGHPSGKPDPKPLLGLVIRIF